MQRVVPRGQDSAISRHLSCPLGKSGQQQRRIWFILPAHGASHIISKGMYVFLCRYGDKAPKSLFARLFATVWMVTGIILLSMFTAQVSSRLTAQELKSEDHLSGKKVTRLFFLVFSANRRPSSCALIG